MKKTIFTLFTLFLLICSLSLPVWGEESLVEEAPLTEAEEQEEVNADTTQTPPVTGALMSFLEDNGGTLLSALGVVVSLLLAFLYKSGLLPLVSRGLKAISESSDKAADITATFTKQAADTLSALESSSAAALSRAEETALMVKGTEEILSALGEALTEAKAERGRIAMVLAEETALFYELLNSVKLPENQKEVIRERYYKYQSILEAHDSQAAAVSKEKDTK